MMSLPELKELVEEVYGIGDISERRFFREYSFARWSFWKIASELGYSVHGSVKFLGFKQHQSGFNAIQSHESNMLKYDVYRELHTVISDRVYGTTSSNDKELPQKIINKLSLMTDEQLEDFDKNRLEPYLKVLKIL